MLLTSCKIAMLAVVASCLPVEAYAQDTLTVSRVTASSKPSATLATAPVRSMDVDAFTTLGYNDVSETIRNFAGATIKDYGGIGGIKTVSVRGLGAQHTTVSYDGVAMADMQSGQTDIGRFSLENVELVSLSIGQSDNIFQTARLFSGAGTLEIRSAKPLFDGKGANVSAAMKGGSFKTFNPSVLYEQKLGERWALGVTSDYLSSDGTYPFTLQNGKKTEELERNNSDVERVRGELNLFGKLGKSGTLNVKGNFLYSERGLPGAVILYNPINNERLWDRSVFASAAYENRMGRKWEMKANLRYSYAWNRYIDISEQYHSGMVDDRYTQIEYYGSVAFLFKATECLSFSAAEDLFYTTLDSTIPECAFPRRTSFLSALAGQYKAGRFKATASLLGTFITETVSSGTAAPDRVHFSPAASISFKLLNDKNFHIRASYKDGFRVPTFNELYYSRTGNRNLKPERAHQFNLGLTWSEGFTATLDGYYNHVQDKIATIPTMFIWKTFNIGEVNIWGFDASAAGTIPLGQRQRLSLSGNYSFQRADETIPYSPENSGAATISWLNPWVNVSYILTAVGARYSLPEKVDRNLVEGYLDHSVSLGHDFKAGRTRISLRGEILNITDKNYSVIKYYPMPGRNWRLTLKISY